MKSPVLSLPDNIAFVPVEQPIVPPSTLTIPITVGTGAQGLTLNDVNFVHPSVPLLQSVYRGLSLEEYQFVYNIPAGTVVDVVLSNPTIAVAHAFHLHGFKFWIVGVGSGTWNESSPTGYNTENPIKRDTFPVNYQGWTTYRFGKLFALINVFS